MYPLHLAIHLLINLRLCIIQGSVEKQNEWVREREGNWLPSFMSLSLWGLASSKSVGQASRLETQARVNVALLNLKSVW
jgi:hypothetical protein